jgi:phage terminase large subunit-like protein
MHLWERYIQRVENHDIVAGKYIRLQVARHKRDLEKQSTEEFPYYFDEKIAEGICKFFPAALKHSIGEHAGQRFEIEEWQAFFLANLFGWQRDDGRGRRFRQAFFTVARKNGKSTLAAGIAMYMAAIDFNPISDEPESRSQIILAATKKEQAEKVIFAECLRMRHQSKLLKDSSTVANKIITFNHNGGNIQCVGSDRPYDGLNPQMVSLDETHAFSNPHRKFYNTMVTGSGSRVQPLLMTTTTAGDDQSHIWLEQIRFCKSVLNDTVKEETLLPIIYELDEDDDPLDEDNWIKANPNLGVSITKDFLNAQAKPCQTSTTALNRFKRYHANVLVSSTERIFSLEDFDQCRGELSDWKQADCVASGIDLGGRDDLAAYALVARFTTGEYNSDDTPIYRYEAKTFSYIARNSKRDLTAIPFCDWIANGLIKVTDSPITDLQHDFVNAYWENFCVDTAIDPYQAQQFGEQVSQQGVVIATMAQTTAHFNEPISDFRQAMADGRFKHDGNPLLRWCLTNAVAVRDRQDRWMLDKSNSSSKIDPLVAMLMAYRRAMVAPGRGDGNVFIT